MQKFIWPFLTLLFTSANAFALIEKTSNSNNKDESAVLKADQIDADRNANIMDAIGHVELSKGLSVLTADTMTYDKNSAVVKANGNVRGKNLEVGKLKATNGEVKDDMSSGVFYNSLMALNNGSYLTSPQTNKINPDITILKKPIFSICPNEEIAANIDEAGKKTDLITIKSTSAKVDQKNQTMSGFNNVVRIYKVPVLYIPYIKFPLPDKKRKSGFLSPSYIKNNRFGIGFKVPYFVDLAPNYDLTVTPLLYTSNNQFTIYNDFRHMAEYGNYKLNFEISSNKITNTTDTLVVNRSKKEYRWYLAGDGKFDFSENTSANYKLSTASDRNYLRDYNYNFTAYTVSEANVDYTNQRDYLSVKTIRFQELVDVNKEKAAPFILPIVNHHIESQKPIFFKEKYELTSNFTSIYREDGLQYRRASVIPEVNVPFNFNGNLFRLNAKLEGDLYYLENNFKNIPRDNNYDTFQSNYKPEFLASWQLPLIQKLKTSTLMVEPMVTFTSSTFFKNYLKLPNEDSNNSELTVNNLFLGDRIPGFDRNETGERISYGVKSSLFNKLGQFDLTLGQSYRISNRQQDIIIRGFNDNNKSNFVGQFNYKYLTYFNLNYLFQLNESNYRNDVNAVSTTLNIGRFTFGNDYLLLKRNNSNLNKVEQTSLSAGIRVTDRLSVTTTASKDFVLNRIISRGIGVIYDGCCVVVNFGITENNSVNLTQKQTSYKINITVKNL